MCGELAIGDDEGWAALFSEAVGIEERYDDYVKGFEARALRPTRKSRRQYGDIS